MRVMLLLCGSRIFSPSPSAVCSVVSRFLVSFKVYMRTLPGARVHARDAQQNCRASTRTESTGAIPPAAARTPLALRAMAVQCHRADRAGAAAAPGPLRAAGQLLDAQPLLASTGGSRHGGGHVVGHVAGLLLVAVERSGAHATERAVEHLRGASDEGRVSGAGRGRWGKGAVAPSERARRAAQ